MKLSRIVLLGSTVLLVCLIIQFVHPRSGIGITQNLRLYFPAAQEIFARKDREEKERLHAILEEEILAGKTAPAVNTQGDTSQLALLRDSIRNVQLSILYPDNDKSLLYPFFNTLSNVRNSKRPIHIVHYGDSQIEGDRITAYIRHRLQKEFGGKGPGWLPVRPLAYPQSIVLKHSENWQSSHFFNRGDSTVSHRLFGHLGIFSRFTAYPGDSTLTDSTIHTAWISYKASSRSYANTKTFKDVRIFYGKNTQPVQLEILHQDSVVFHTTLDPTASPRVVRYTFPRYVSQVIIRFTGNDSPDVYGVSLDDTQGLMMDNIGWRGDSGANFTTLDEASYPVAFREFNIPLFILQFGGNAVPFAKTEERIKGYARNFKRNIQYIKRLEPGAAVIVIGPSDMCVLDGTNWVTYPQLPLIRDALKAAAFEAGAAYWDLLEAMGGKGSMKEWVNANPPLAIKDYAHFTDKGAVRAGQWFADALLKDYREYKQIKENKLSADRKGNEPSE